MPMIGKHLGITLAALAGATAVAAPALAQNEQFIPNLVYRTGAYAPNGIPFANGIADYYKLVNERDGGINGVKIVFENATPATPQARRGMLRAAQGQGSDRCRLRHSAVDHAFALWRRRPSTDRSSPWATAARVARRLGVPVEFPAARHLLDGGRHHPEVAEGRRLRQLKGKKIARLSRLLTADRTAAEARGKHGFEAMLLPVISGVEQKATWLPRRTVPTMCCSGAGA
jgi:hypothetical protein